MTIWRNGPPKFPEFTAMSVICAVIILLPITSHYKAKNVATLSMIAWLFTINAIRIVNSIYWANNVDYGLTVWCDISESTKMFTCDPVI
jgi:pheromone a factor receptor